MLEKLLTVSSLTTLLVLLFVGALIEVAYQMTTRELPHTHNRTKRSKKDQDKQ